MFSSIKNRFLRGLTKIWFIGSLALVIAYTVKLTDNSPPAIRVFETHIADWILTYLYAVSPVGGIEGALGLAIIYFTLAVIFFLLEFLTGKRFPTSLNIKRVIAWCFK